jgi:hypothetical protein|tara:strand:- start:92 stop:346 length:255 start_codon:yes stop_codon:yes gene_type:complete
MSEYNPNDFVNPQQIRSPYTGETVRPTYNSYDHQGKTYEQAVFSDPVTGHQIKKGLVSIKDKDGNVIVDYTSILGQSVTTQSRR